MKKCKCKYCNYTKWEIVNKRNYSFIFTCLRCGKTFEMISLVDLELRCENV